MAKLPNITEDRQVIQAGVNQGISIPEIPASPINEAVAKFGAATSKVGEELVNTENHIQRFNYALNKSKLVREHAALVNNLEKQINDIGDYTTAQEDYTKGIQKLGSDLGGGINHPLYKGKFNEDIEDLKTNTLQKVYQLQTKAQQDHSYTLANQELDNTVQAVMNTKDSTLQQQIIKAGLAPVIAAIPNTDPDKDSKVAAVEKVYKKRIGVGVFNSLTPQQQIAALSDYDKNSKAGTKSFSTVEYIPAEERPIYMKRAQESIKQQQNDLEANIKKADFLKYHGAKENALKIVEDGGSLKDLPIDQAARLNEQDWKNLNRVQEIKNGTYQMNPIEGDKAYYDYSNIYQTDPEALVKIDPIKIRAEVNPDKVNEVLGWQQKAQQKISAPVNLKTYNSVANQTLSSLGIGPNNKKAIPFKNRLNEELEYFKETHGKDPTVKELTSMAQDLVVKATFDGGWLGKTKEKMIYQIPKDEIAKQIVVPEDFTTKIISQAQKAGLGPLNQDQIKAAYLRKLNER